MREAPELGSPVRHAEPLDPANPVVKLCVEGMAAEAQARAADAAALFMEAWGTSRDDFEACIAAHYVARHQSSVEAELHWNEEALRRAAAVAGERVRGFYPSLHLNVAYSLERLGRLEEARRHYALAASSSSGLPASPYANFVRMGIDAGRSRVAQPGESP